MKFAPRFLDPTPEILRLACSNYDSSRLQIGAALCLLAASLGSLNALPANLDPKAPSENRSGVSVQSRVDALINQMTLDEKISLLGGDTDNFSTMAVPRLGIPKLIMADGPQGVRNYGKACLFPAGVTLAATWDTSLAERYGRGIGLEARARGVHIMLGPGVNICRLPVNGRNFEYFGEDPLLASKVSSRWIFGMQDEGVIATIKHYAGNNQETARGQVDVRMDDRSLHEIYLPTFRSAVEESHVWGVMAAYNRFRGSYCGGSDLLENKILKGEFGFKGTLMSDWGACHSPSDLAAGLDLEMGHGTHFLAPRIKEAMEKGEVKLEHIDDSVRRLLRAAISMGFFDREQKRPEIPLDSPESSRVALEVARAGIVLLKNDKAALPLERSKIHKIAVYGPNALVTPSGGGGSGGVSSFHTVNFLDGIRALSGSNVEVVAVRNPESGKEEIARCPLVHTAVDGPVGFNLTVKTRRPDASITLPVQSGINLEWKTGLLPLGVEAEVADYDYSGVLVPEEDGTWEVACANRAMIELGGIHQSLVTGDFIHVKKGEPIPISLHYHDIRRDRDANKPRSFRDWFVLRKPQLPDLMEAKKVDAVVVCVGLRTAWEGEGYDRNFDLPEAQGALIRALAEANPRVIVTVNSGAAVGMLDWIHKVPAVLETWYLGQEGGTALAEVLFGDVNPSGRLPSSFDRTFADNPAAPNYPGKPEAGNSWPVVHYAEGIFMGYRGYDKAGKDPLFPFGHGLSYTTFDYSGLNVAKSKDGSAVVSLKVKNSGPRAGSEVVQIYVGQPKCSVERPIRELKGFSKLALQPGETKTVTISLSKEAFAFWHPEKRAWTVEPGEFTIEAGQSSRKILLKSALTIDHPVTLVSQGAQSSQ